jgi:hypothetical protein
MVTLFFWVAGAWAGGSQPREAFFHIHQAAALLEEVKKGKCPRPQPFVDSHLSKAEKLLAHHPATTLIALFQKLSDAQKSIDELGLVEIEKIREEVHILADAYKFEHPKSWDQEIRRCGRGQNAPESGAK